MKILYIALFLLFLSFIVSNCHDVPEYSIEEYKEQGHIIYRYKARTTSPIYFIISEDLKDKVIIKGGGFRMEKLI